MSDILAIVGTAIDTVKKLRQVAQKIKDADTQNLIADLSISLADLKMEIAALRDENLRLQDELKKRDGAQDHRNNMEVRDGVLYLKEPPQGRPQGPYCPNCMERSKQLVLIKDHRGTPFQAISNFFCSLCRSHF